VVIDNGGGNSQSIVYALDRLGVRGVVSGDSDVIRQADRVILPGVGAAKAAMQRLHSYHLVEVIQSLTQPVLGICLGMQLMFEYSEEGQTTTLGIMEGSVRQLPAHPHFPRPHMGWNQLKLLQDSPLWVGVDLEPYVYFVHGFAVLPSDSTLAVCEYGGEWVAACQKDNFIGVQFHPERSSRLGAQILSNFLKWPF
jgi:glutamine amidotransferase